MDSRAVIRTIEYVSMYTAKDGVRESRFLRDGEKVYQASLRTRPDGINDLPSEASWDGERSYMRTRPGMLAVSKDKSRWHQSVPCPDTHLLSFLSEGMGILSELPHVSRDLSVKATLIAGSEAPDGKISLTYANTDRRGRQDLTTIHDPQRSYWPVQWKIQRPDGSVIASVERVEFAQIDEEGKTGYFPTHFIIRQHLTRDGQPVPGDESLLEHRVVSLRMNEPIDPARFVLDPWPLESLYLEDEERIEPPVDPNWDPAGKVGFPFEEAFRRLLPS
jgi:hypothetical protein